MASDGRETTKCRYLNRQKTLEKLGYSSYQEYLKSELWSRIRNEEINRYQGKCGLCQKKPAYTVHHHDYSKQALLGSDRNRLTPICKSCHRKIEFDSEGNKLFATTQIVRKTRTSKKQKPICRACQKKKKRLGRNDICLQCYKRYKHNVHDIAEKRSG